MAGIEVGQSVTILENSWSVLAGVAGEKAEVKILTPYTANDPDKPGAYAVLLNGSGQMVRLLASDIEEWEE